MNRIVYKNTDSSISVIVPVQEVLDAVGIKAIAEKDVPQDLPYWFCAESELPTTRDDRDNWIWDTTKDPDGFGGESHEFTDEQLLALYNEGVING